jgi:hypothetical protein
MLTCYVPCVSGEIPAVPFLCSRVNYAWGYDNAGWFIDSSGAVHSYTFTQSDSVGYGALMDTLPLKMYDKLLAKSTLTGKKVSRDTLLSKLTLIEPASSGILSHSGACFDAGIYRYSAFLYDAYHSRQKEIICYQIGDEWIYNSASGAKKIACWLNSIDSADLRFCTPPDSCLILATGITVKGPLTIGKPLRTVMCGKTIVTRIPQSEITVIRAYTIRGELLPRSFEQFLTAGEHRIDLSGIFNGIQSKKPFVLEFSVNGVRAETRTVIFSQGR